MKKEKKKKKKTGFSYDLEGRAIRFFFFFLVGFILVTVNKRTEVERSVRRRAKPASRCVRSVRRVREKKKKTQVNIKKKQKTKPRVLLQHYRVIIIQ